MSNIKKVSKIKFKKFLLNKDKENWIKIQNSARKGRKDYIPLTLERMREIETSPTFDTKGMFFAELNGKLIGCVDGSIDKNFRLLRGVILDLAVIPEFRGQGFGKIIVEKAIEDLKQRGIKFIETNFKKDWVGCKNLYESLGFKLIRVFSTMRRDLKNISNINGNNELKIRLMETNSEDIELCNRLSNEIFREHFNYRPETLEETRYYLTIHPRYEILKVFFAFLGNRPIGYVIIGINLEFFKLRGIKRGEILDLGVLKSYRRQGVGRALILHALEDLRNKGMTEVELEVDDSNEFKAISLYEKMEFKNVRKNYVYRLT